MTDPGISEEGEKEVTNIPPSWRPTRAAPIPVIRCTAIKKDGDRCGRWSLRGADKCIKHGAQLPTVREHADAVVEAARVRLMGMSDEAVDVLEDLMKNASADKIRLDAAKDVLNRSGISGPLEVDVTVTQGESPAEAARRRLAENARRLTESTVVESTDVEDIVDAEVEEDDLDGE